MQVTIINMPPAWVAWFGYSGFLLFVVALAVLAVRGLSVLRSLKTLTATAEDLQSDVDRNVMPNVEAITQNVETITEEIATAQANATEAIDKVTNLITEIKESPVVKIAGTVGTVMAGVQAFRKQKEAPARKRGLLGFLGR